MAEQRAWHLFVFEATWVVRGVSAEEDLTMVVRHDQSVSSRYHVEVNGRASPHDLEAPRLPEQWGKTSVTIPRRLLRDGENRFRFTRDRSLDGEAELFHIWFVQEKRGDEFETTRPHR